MKHHKVVVQQAVVIEPVSRSTRSERQIGGVFSRFRAQQFPTDEIVDPNVGGLPTGTRHGCLLRKCAARGHKGSSAEMVLRA
jgi:hypothetical protein